MTVLSQETMEAAPATPTADKPIDIDVFARRCVYVNNFRVAGGKPYHTENLPQHTLNTTLGEVLRAFRPDEIRAALDEQEARAKYFRDAHDAAKLVEVGDAA